MTHMVPPTYCLNLSERIREGVPICASQSPSQRYAPSMFITHERPYTTAHSHTIDILDDDSLVNVFRLYRPDLLDEDEIDDIRILEGGEWHRERWWYELAHVC